MPVKTLPSSISCHYGQKNTTGNPFSLADGQSALEAVNLSFCYDEDRKAVSDVNFRIMPGETVALCGHNGSGKTTLMKLLAGLLKPLTGLVKISGVELDHLSARHLFRTVGLMFQDPHDQLFCTHVGEDVAYGPRNMKLADDEITVRVHQAMETTDTGHLEQRPIHHLSGGEMKRVALAGLVAMKTPLLLLDEPFSGLDPASTGRLVSLIRHLTDDHGYTLVMTTHQMSLVPEVARRMLVMQGGRLVADGAAREVLTDIPLLKSAGLQTPDITRFFYEKALRKESLSEKLPLTVEEALN